MNKSTGKMLSKRLKETFQADYANQFKATERRQLESLIDLYYRHISLADVGNQGEPDLLGSVIAHWQLLRDRKGNETVIRVYNPNFEEHGWQSANTIIEIVSTDWVFLVDSLSMGLNRSGQTIYLTIHPVVWCSYNKSGRLQTIVDESGDGDKAVSLIHIELEKQLSPEVLRTIKGLVDEVISDVRAANIGWLPIKEQIGTIRKEMAAENLPVERAELDEARAFLNWIDQDNFTFLAYCELQLSQQRLQVKPDSLLGLFSKECGEGYPPEQVIPLLKSGEIPNDDYLLVTKANSKSRVHRPAYMDLVCIKRFDQEGRVVGLFVVLGLFTSSAYNSPPKDIPLLRCKAQAVIDHCGFSPASHSGKALENILVTYPRDILFQIAVPELLEMALGILGLQERQRTRLFVYRELFGRYYSCLVYLPRERYNRELRLRIQEVLVEALQGSEVEFTTFFSESSLARIHDIVHCDPDTQIELDIGELEAQVAAATTTWQDELRTALIELYGEARATAYFKEYANSFPGSFKEDSFPRSAAADIARIEWALQHSSLGMTFYHPILESSKRIHCRLYSPGKPVPLSDAIPILENMGLSVFGENPYRINHTSGPIWIHDFAMRHGKSLDGFDKQAYHMMREAFIKSWDGRTDNDGFNQLVLDAGLDWKQVMLLRAYSRYMKQIKVPYSSDYIINTLVQNANITKLLVEFFYLRFDPTKKRNTKREQRLEERIESGLERVSSLDQDRILRHFLNLIQSTLRSNYFQLDAEGEPKDYISFKISPRLVSGIPLPVPMFEIFVFSARMEGVHLRGGPVARGGLRWSDRMEDFRTEVLGLMKAQMVKNTVIVPVGSKGGFIVKRPPGPGSREKLMEEVVACYSTLLRGMLDVTDNLVDGKVVPPERVVRQDDDDPYLVIAADKGTATFSDIANGIAEEYGFWLGDAFASGGSVGYDHKKMGITARGAWESVKRNFRELGVDIQSSDFRVIGIGDMSGDVFGNGMLLSRHIRLVAAFNHMHIFLDPEPDAEISYRERERLFKLPRSSWTDYDAKLISKGGGVFPRSAKSIPISDEVKAMVGIKEEKLTPTELINYLLKAQVDLIWNGGIGTYIKSESESHEQVGDKANDGLRVNGNQLRCKVVGEGGNLGVTQLGRIEFAAKGGLIYTDAIDNSAGVDCSDHEVNIKILLGQIVSNGDMTTKQRNRLLEQMTDEVAELVLDDNYAQTQAISMVESEAPLRLTEHSRFIDYLENEGRLNRELEFLPSKQEISERQAQRRGLTKPELSVLHAYSKMTYYVALINSDIPDDPFLQAELNRYFPAVLSERFAAEMADHRLRREIIATHLTNNIVDHIGPGFGFRVREEAGTNIAGVTRAYLSASKIYSTDELWSQIEALDNQVSSKVQLEMMRMLAQLLEHSVLWLLRTLHNQVVVSDVVETYRGGVEELVGSMPKPLAASNRLMLNRKIRYFVAEGVPRPLAEKIAAVVPLTYALDIVDVANQRKRDVLLVSQLFFNLGGRLEFNWIREQIAALGVQNHWHSMAKSRLIVTLDNHQRELASQMLVSGGRQKVAKRIIDQWCEDNSFAVDRHLQMITDLKARSSVDFAMLSVLVAGVAGLLKSKL